MPGAALLRFGPCPSANPVVTTSRNFQRSKLTENLASFAKTAPTARENKAKSPNKVKASFSR